VKPNPIALLIDDDRSNRRLLRTLLESEGYRVIESNNGRRGLAAAADCQPDVIILELVLPDRRGLTVLKQLRRSRQTPVLILSTRDREQDIVAALDGGADAYLTKPFGERDLLARLRVIRRCDPDELNEVVLLEGEFTVDAVRHRVILLNRRIELTPIEEAIAQLLAIHAGKIVPFKFLLHSVWGAEEAGANQRLRVFISSLRKKLEGAGGRVFIESAGQVGYRLVVSPFQRGADPIKDCDLLPTVQLPPAS
jgi:two-component system KDP operon response regulator KdpE